MNGSLLASHVNEPNARHRHRAARPEALTPPTRSGFLPANLAGRLDTVLQQQELVHLQKLAGNQAVARLLVGSHEPGLHSHALRGGQPEPRITVQTKKTAKPADTFWLKKLDQELGSTAPFGTVERMDQVWAALNQRYAGAAGKGANLWSGLLARQRQFHEDPVGVATDLQAVRADYERRYRDHYISTVRSTGPSGAYEVGTSGYEEQRPLAPDENVYLTRLNIDRRVIDVVRAYATRDDARIRDERVKAKEPHEKIGLPNSEVLWQQFLGAAQEYFWYQKEARAKELVGKITGLTVHQASNTLTQQVVFMAYPNDLAWDDGDEVWRPEQEEFQAILGTPNVSMAAFMLMDHIDELGGRSIESITTRGGKDHYIDITFSEPAASYDRAIALAMGLIVVAGLAAWYFT